MKITRYLGSFLLIFATLFFAGCGTAGGLLAKRMEKVTVNQWVPVVTETAPGVLETNKALVPVEVEQPVYTVAPKIESGVAAATKGLETVANFVPAARPAVTVAEAGLGLVTGFLGLFAWVKTRLAARNKSALDKAGTMLRTVVAGVESYNDSDLKRLIAERATVADIAHELHATVQAITAQMQQAPSAKAATPPA